MNEKIRKDLVESAYIKMKLAEHSLQKIELATRWILEAYQQGGRLVLFGNGGSAADAQHIAGEFVNYFRIPGRPMVDCLSLTTNTSILTAIANDTSYDNVFAKQVESLVNCKDVILALSTSGNAKNVIKGIEMAKKRGARTILLTGEKGGKAAPLADLVIHVPSNDTPRIQESHITIGHIISDIVEHELFKDYLVKSQDVVKEATGSASARINFGNGGDTDYYIDKIVWGCVINTTLESHKYNCTLRKMEDSKEIVVKIKNSFYEGKDESKFKKEYLLNDIKESSKKDLIAATLYELYPDFKGEVLIETNIPEMSGLGGSSALGVSLINAISQIHKKEISSKETAYLAYKIEREILGINGGYQDQFAAASGNGFNYMEFKKAKTNDLLADVTIFPWKINPESLKKIEDGLLLFYLENRDISGNQAHIDQKEKLTHDEDNIKRILIEKRDNALDIRDALPEGNIPKIGSLLHKDYELKKMLNPSVNKENIEEIYEGAISLGAYGGRISGAGSGGCMFLLCDSSKKQGIIKFIESKGGIHLPCELAKPK